MIKISNLQAGKIATVLGLRLDLSNNYLLIAHKWETLEVKRRWVNLMPDYKRKIQCSAQNLKLFKKVLKIF